MQGSCWVYFTFALIMLVNIWINFDHGVMPAGATTIKTDLELTNTLFGGLGSIVFVGLAIGSIFAVFFF
jgi:hypothetical protein